MNSMENRIRRLEEEAPKEPCNHPLGILIDPSEEEVERLNRELAECSNCRRDSHDHGPATVVIRFAKWFS